MMLKHFSKHLVLTLSFYLTLTVFFCLYLWCKNDLHLLTEIHFLRFDAILYDDIKTNGYHQNWLCAFFPAFPFVWKILNLSVTGVSILNAVIFFISISIISCEYKMQWKQSLFFLSFPSLVFMFVPYTEAIFFAACSILLIGLKRNRLSLILPGLLLSSLIRPTTFVFIPALIGAYFFSNQLLKQGLIKSIIPSFVLIVGLFATITTHFYYTKIWFVFFEAQKLWKNHLHVPQLPLTSWGGDATVRLDGSALFISIICGIYIITIFFNKVKTQLIFKPDLIFSLLYLLGTSILILAYRDGNLYSLNRFIYATPFIIVAISYLFEKYQFKWRDTLYIFLLSEFFWLFFNSYNHILNLLLFTCVSIYFILLLLTKHRNLKIANISIFALIIINCIGLIKLSYRFLNGGWIG